MHEKESRAITVDEFAALVAEELNFDARAQTTFARKAEAIMQGEPYGRPQCASYAYYADDRFRSLREISREEAAALMALASELVGEDAPKLSSIEVVRTLATYRDAKLVAAWAMPALAAALQFEWMGCPNDEIKPKHFMTSHEAARMVRRFAMDIQ